MKKLISFLTVGIIFCYLHQDIYAEVYTQSSGTVTQTDQTYSTSTADESAVKITGGTLTLTNCTITKSGDVSNSDNSNFYGLNAAVLNYGSSGVINMSGGTITTSGKGANAFYAYKGSSTISDVTISCTANSSRGLFATGGGTITASNITATTAGSNSSVIATDRGSGTVNVTGGTYRCTGTDAAVMYSTGVITASGITGSSAKGEIAVIEGSNSVTVTGESNITAGSSSRGIMVLQSGSGDAEGTTGTFTMTGGSLIATGSSAPLIEVVTNATGNICLNSVTTTIASGILMMVDYNTRWTTHAATGNLYLNGSYTYTGDIVADSYSKANTNILTGATLVGKINTDNTALLTKLTMDSNSTWNVTGTSYINGLITNPGISGTSVSNIIGNGYNVYYTTSTNSVLGGLTYSLVNGGYLLPVGATAPTNTLSLSSSSVSIAKEAGSTASVTVTSNTTWSVSSDQSWLTVSPSSNSGNGTITFTAEANTTVSSRTATVTVTAGTLSKIIEVVQEAGTTSTQLSSMGEEIIVYPNPTTHGVFIKGINGIATLTMMDLNGKQWIKSAVANGDYISTTTLQEGLYLVQIETSNEKIVKRVIVKRK
ncbi:MAG TPA: BACON domain-containing carbohydrate-binding protein [Prolixibacteraceae bacterium]|nr:BACON domain-containing carbohydrate-binding protein [Prolixibacteraceae bacterium]